VKLFITHGGLLSTQEASYNGVPLVGIPMMGDQLMNVLHSENLGYAVSLPYATVTKEAVLSAVKKILSDPKYVAENNANLIFNACKF
jgi:glucuronosyltransferase